jgi:hypothetical protein
MRIYGCSGTGLGEFKCWEASILMGSPVCRPVKNRRRKFSDAEWNSGCYKIFLFSTGLTRQTLISQRVVGIVGRVWCHSPRGLGSFPQELFCRPRVVTRIAAAPIRGSSGGTGSETEKKKGKDKPQNWTTKGYAGSYRLSPDVWCSFPNRKSFSVCAIIDCAPLVCNGELLGRCPRPIWEC